MANKKDSRFEQVLKDTQSQVRAYIAGMGVPLSEVDDLAQEVYLAFYKSLEKMPKDLLEIRWLKGIAKNICFEYFRGNKKKIGKEMEYLAEVMSDYSPVTDKFKEEDAAGLALKHCMEKLTEANRNLIRLKYDEGRDTKYLAELMNKSLEAVRIMMFRIKEALKDCVSRSLLEKEKT